MRIHRQGPADACGLLLIHGLSSSHRVWQRNLAVLGQDRRLLIAELFSRGAGLRFRLADQADQLAEALSGEPQPLAVIGHSLGGLVAVELALRHPAVVERLVLMAVPAMPATSPLTQRLRGLTRPGVLADARSIAVVARTVLTGNPLQLLDATFASVARDRSSAASAIDADSLIVWGSADAIVPLEIGRRLADVMPRARLQILEAVGDQPQWERPDTFHATVLPFLGAA